MSGFLVVPTHLEAFRLSSDQPIVEAMADFSRLPYFDPDLKREINSDHANLSEEILSVPFQSQNLNLKAGIHLHWSLPDALTRGLQQADQTVFPPAPNRWLVTRTKDGARRKTWIVESDFVHPTDKLEVEKDIDYTRGAAAESESISYFYRQVDSSPEPFRFVGRQMPLEEWAEADRSSYFPMNHPLTAIGYGEVTFAAFYPNCHSVFGFHDAEVSEFGEVNSLHYEVVGWYADAANDPLRNWLATEAVLSFIDAEPDQNKASQILTQALGIDPFKGRTSGESLRSQLLRFCGTQSAAAGRIFEHAAFRNHLCPDKLEHFNWSISKGADGDKPERLLVYSSLKFPEFQPHRRVRRAGHEVEGHVDIAVGNSTMEAFSAYLAYQLASDFGIDSNTDAGAMERLEDQLESLYLSAKLSNRSLDIGPKFREARHNTGFEGVSGGVRWTVDLQSPVSPAPIIGEQEGDALQAAEAQNAQSQRRVNIPKEIHGALTLLNRAQAESDELETEIQSRRRQLFADWYKYMLSVYHPADAIRGDDYPDIDLARFFVEEVDCDQLDAKIGDLSAAKFRLSDQRSKTVEAIRLINESLLVHLRPDSGPDSARLLKSVRRSRKRREPDLNPNHGLKVIDVPDATDDPANQDFARCIEFGKETAARLTWASSPTTLRALTVSAWVKPRAGVTEENNFVLFSIGSMILELRSLPMNGQSEKRRFSVRYSGEDHDVGLVESARWLHLAFAYEAAAETGPIKLEVFINGRRFPVPVNRNAPQLNIGRLHIGGREAEGIECFHGHMTHIRVDDRALSPAEIRRDMNNGVRPRFRLYPKASSRYWQPTEPVVLLTGKGIRETERHGQDGQQHDTGLHPCSVVSESSIDKGGKMDPEALLKTLRESPSHEAASWSWDGQPWHPLLLEWEVLMQPIKGKSNVDGAAFSADVISANYELPDNAADLRVKEDRRALSGGAFYSNSCVLTPHSGSLLRERIADFLNNYLVGLRLQVAEFAESDKEATEHGTKPRERRKALGERHYHRSLKRWFEGEDPPAPALVPSDSKPNLTRERLLAFKAFHEAKPTYASARTKFSDLPKAEQAKDPVYVIICAGLKLFDPEGQPRAFLSQALGGFNEELLMRKQTLQLPVDDPLAFPEDRNFTQRVAKLLDGEISSAPEPANQFNPIRTGAMQITRLRLVDTFGQVKDFNHEEILKARSEIITPQRLTVPGSPHRIWMPPRLVQPARIDFRWLRARKDDPNSTPICGWLLPNNLQKILAVYDESGMALGSLIKRVQGVEWVPEPGSNREVDEISNPHLRKLVEHLLRKDDFDRRSRENFLEDLLTAIESALETIAPESHAQHQSLALLVGRPIAIVRASIDLQLNGPPAVHQGWHAFQADMNRTERETNDFTKVRFPIRIGEFQQLNDGVVGYWKEDGDGYEWDKFYAPQTPDNAQNLSIDHPDIVIHGKHWIEKSAFIDACNQIDQKIGSRGEEAWNEMLRKGWIRSLGDEEPFCQIEGKADRKRMLDNFNQAETGAIEEILRIHANNPLNLQQSVDSPPQTVTILFDPRAKLHLTSGILPTKVIDIPAPDYAPALDAIQVSFLTAPILTPHGSRSVALPKEPGFAWSWREHKRWITETTFHETLKAQRPSLQKEVVGKLWERLQECGWIRRANGSGDLFRIVPMGRRTSEQFDIIEKSEFKTRLNRLSDTADAETVWNFLLDPNVRWLRLHSPQETHHAEIVPKNRRVMLQLKQEHTDTPNYEELQPRLEELFTSYLEDELGGAWRGFEADRGESIARLEDWIERLFWSDFTEVPVIDRGTFLHQLRTLANFPENNCRQIWDRLQEPEIHWLTPVPTDPAWAGVVPVAERLAQTLQFPESNGYPTILQSRIERILHAEAIELSPVETGASFESDTEIREGWLVLQREAE
jgi:hypothetical protein